ncbi:MAG: hypothetical protein JWM95_2557 [Gemmatimonadetes bacterium]|nr:hypothetical protein [Gemmatimonadota bacterium]
MKPILRLAVLVVVGGIPALAQSVRRPLAIEDYYRLKTIGAPELSPDGRWAAFTVTTRVEENNGAQSEVWLAPFDASSAARRVSADGASATVPGWTADGRLRFNVAGRGYVIDPARPDRVDSTDAMARRTGRGGGAPAVPVASPDGKWLASVRDTPPMVKKKTFATDFEKRHDERFKGVQFDWLEFHRDGAQFPLPNVTDPQVSPPQELFVAATGDDASVRQLTHLAVRPVGMQWNRAGTELLFSADSTYRNERLYGRTDIFTVTMDGKVKRLTPNNEYDYNGARYSPDGRWILASRQLSTDAILAKKLTHGGAVDLVVIPVEGGAERVLTAEWDYIPAGAQWSADGKFVYFTGGVGGTTHLFRVSPDGGPVRQVTTGQRRLGGFSFDSAFSHMAYSVATFDAPSELWAANIDGTGEHQITHVFDAFTSEIALSPAERLQFKSRDGTPIEGWVTLPAGYDARKRYPLVVSNHGGPHSAIEYGLNFKNQYLAANGYLVLEVNFRSSTNYGEQFLWATWGAWGTKDGQDVMAGVDYVIAHYPVDKLKVATIGHSYGGFMTNWLITQYPTRFAAAIPGAGIVNWTSDYANSDIPRTKETEFLGAPWDPKAREVMLKQSPLMYANRVKAPTLFINGEIDQRVPYSEAQQFYVALKKNGVPTKMIQYAGMPHSISGSWNIVHRMLNERQWLDRWLKNSPLP